MRNKRHKQHKDETDIQSPADAVDCLVAYFTGDACRHCAFRAVDFLYETLRRDDAVATAVDKAQHVN